MTDEDLWSWNVHQFVAEVRRLRSDVALLWHSAGPHAEEIRVEEREACAKVADEADKYDLGCRDVAAAIRARGKPGEDPIIVFTSEAYATKVKDWMRMNEEARTEAIEECAGVAWSFQAAPGFEAKAKCRCAVDIGNAIRALGMAKPESKIERSFDANGSEP
jgi:hypothetical protein